MIDQIKKLPKSPLDAYRFSILLPTWNNLDYLKLCIRSIQEHSELDIQIIVFVNEGKDGTIKWLEEQGNIDYLHSKENAGICYALNLARSMAKSDYIVYLNDDMVVLPNWDTELDKEIQKMPSKSFMLSATMIEPTDTGNACVVVKDYGDSIETFKKDQLLQEYTGLRRNDWSGSTWPPNVVHKDLWDAVGGLSIEFSPGMYSDPDFSKKLYEAGVRIFKGVGSSLVYHFGSKSTKKLKRSRGRELFLFKWEITSNVFSNKILKRGQPYEIIQSEPNLSKEKTIGKLKILGILFKSK
jgi:glycosyltransferase involved in cell wall biosynthesis